VVVRAAVECVVEYRATVTHDNRLAEAENALAERFGRRGAGFDASLDERSSSAQPIETGVLGRAKKESSRT
jgi:hypothetical protein